VAEQPLQLVQRFGADRWLVIPDHLETEWTVELRQLMGS